MEDNFLWAVGEDDPRSTPKTLQDVVNALDFQPVLNFKILLLKTTYFSCRTSRTQPGCGLSVLHLLANFHRARRFKQVATWEVCHQWSYSGVDPMSYNDNLPCKIYPLGQVTWLLQRYSMAFHFYMREIIPGMVNMVRNPWLGGHGECATIVSINGQCSKLPSKYLLSYP